jgi:hypothetical protein
MKKQDIYINTRKQIIIIKSIGIIINNKNAIRINKIILSEVIQISVVSFNLLAKKKKKENIKSLQLV